MSKKYVQMDIPSVLLQQNCFVRQYIKDPDIHTDYSETSYQSLDERVTDKGLEIVYNEYPYHITPDYVNSFVDSSDYHNDPLGFINKSVSRPNIGDVSSIQNILSMDTLQQKVLYDQLSAKFSKQSSSGSSSDSSSGSSSATVNNGGNN